MAESYPSNRSPFFKDLVGLTFGRLTVVDYDGARGKPKPRHYWRCECSCQSGILVIAEGANLRGGNSKSCGCLRRENMKGTAGIPFTKIPGKVMGLIAYPGYLVSSRGDVYSCWNTGPHNRMTHLYYKLSPGLTRAAYLHVNVSGTHRLVHALVLEAFVGPCPDGLECRHLDGNPQNNNRSNLCWGTRRENANDRVKHGKVTTAQRCLRGSTKLDEEKVQTILELRSQGVVAREIAESFGISMGMVYLISRGQCWKYVNRPTRDKR
jgi:hypothetical protein